MQLIFSITGSNTLSSKEDCLTSTLLHKLRHTKPVLATLKIRTKHNKLRERVQKVTVQNYETESHRDGK